MTEVVLESSPHARTYVYICTQILMFIWKEHLCTLNLIYSENLILWGFISFDFDFECVTTIAYFGNLW